MVQSLLEFESPQDTKIHPTPQRDFSLILEQPMIRSRSQAACRKVTPSPATDFAGVSTEKRLPNGDLYIGTFLGSVPHGSGKYLWADGCMYEGDWKKGKATGKGRFSWPSGATYEGEFRSGRMEGTGTFTGADGDTYRGSWVSDKKHGYGEKHYVNGDFYQGYWRRNLQDGQGKYVWKNGNFYQGEWKNGVICGKGVLVWANGERFEGVWENGVPKGNNGSFSYPWSELLGPTTPKKRLSADSGGGRASGGGGGERIFPRICIWESDGEAGDITCDIVDNVEAASMMYGGDRFWGLDRAKPFRGTPHCPNKEAKRPGQPISKGHKNYELMLNLQLGIRYSIGKQSSVLRDLKPSDFDPREKFWTRFPSEGSKLTPPHQTSEFRWKDYCPMVFRHLRELFQVDPADYMLAICGNDALRELSSPGKSGSFFLPNPR